MMFYQDIYDVEVLKSIISVRGKEEVLKMVEHIDTVEIVGTPMEYNPIPEELKEDYKKLGNYNV